MGSVEYPFCRHYSLVHSDLKWSYQPGSHLYVKWISLSKFNPTVLQLWSLQFHRWVCFVLPLFDFASCYLNFFSSSIKAIRSMSNLDNTCICSVCGLKKVIWETRKSNIQNWANASNANHCVFKNLFLLTLVFFMYFFFRLF